MANPTAGAPDTTLPLDRPVTLHLVNVRLGEAVRAINLQAHLHLNYSDRLFPAARLVTLDVVDMPAGQALARVLTGTDVVIRRTASGDLLLERRAERSESPQSTSDTTMDGAVTGQVRDSANNNQALAGAEVAVKGTTRKTITNHAGWYGIRLPAGEYTLTVRSIGYVPQSHTVRVLARQFVEQDFEMQQSATHLGRIVTTATGDKKLYELGTSVTVLNVDSIVATQPVSTVTDILEGRVPGLTVERTSGLPGAPARLRLRGVSSAYTSNDPIVIVDGVRIYYGQSDSTSGNLAVGGFQGASQGAGVPAPSPLDQIDPHTIKTIEVFKGPSASTMYGPDAANGVIVVTTKAGQDGPARWTATVSRGMTSIPGRYPTGYYAWGHDTQGNTALCSLADLRCTTDSLVRFQALNSGKYSVLRSGDASSYSLGVSGGQQALTYAITGSLRDETGIVKLPGLEAQVFQQQHGAPPPAWMQNPDQLSQWSVTGQVHTQISPKLDVSIVSRLTRTNQQQSTLDESLSEIMQTYVSPGGVYWTGSPGYGFNSSQALVADFYRKITDQNTNFTNSATVNWRPIDWFTGSADAGINVVDRSDQALLPGQMLPSDTAGRLTAATLSTVENTVDLRGTAFKSLPLGLRLDLALGANYQSQPQAGFSADASGLVPGTTSLTGAGQISARQYNVTSTTYGWYLQPSIHSRLFNLNTGIRIDGGSTLGTHATLPTFPKLDFSYAISEVSWFPFRRYFDLLNLRIGYGQAGEWPGAAQALRLYASAVPWLNGGFVPATQVTTLGNTKLRPEKSSELDGGFDADMFDDRLSLQFSAFKKMRFDALMNVPIAPSVYGRGVSQLQNIGVIRNTGFELDANVDVVRSGPFTWNVGTTMSRDHNQVVRLGNGVLPFYDGQGDRIVAGYPLFSRWALPILGYADANHDGIIEPWEVQLGDTAVYMGDAEPNFTAGGHTNVSLFRGAVAISANFTYQNGMTQDNFQAGGVLSRGMSDPTASFAQQAAVTVLNQTDYGQLQRVNYLRFQSLSVMYYVPRAVAQRLGASAVSVALQGTNLRLWTNYTAGKDPDVNAWGWGNGVADTGQLPMPRTWSLAITANY